MENYLSDFCPCRDRACRLHPSNHEKGCSLCIEKNIKNKEIPSCFFNAAGCYPSKYGYSFEAFAKTIAQKEEK